MASEKGKNKKKREEKKVERLKRLVGLDLCACGPGHKLQCHGICRELHTKGGQVQCGEFYQIERPPTKQSGARRSKRNWKFGRQKEAGEKQSSRQQRYKKIQRDSLD